MSPENQQQKEKYEALRAQSQKMKKKILLVMLCIVGAIVILLAAIKLIEFFLLSSNSEPTVPETDEPFYATYEGDIMENPDYLGLDRFVYYCDNLLGLGLTQAIGEENRDEFDSTVLFLYDYVQTVIAGDNETYNRYFNENYFEKRDPQGGFSPQMLYNIKILFDETEIDSNGDKLMTYRLDYMIYRNDGTFRRDVGSDAIAPQFVTLRVTSDGDISIEKLITQYAVDR